MKRAICSVITKNYVNYLRVFCFSLLQNNPDFNDDYIVFHVKGDLSLEQKSDLLKLYRNFKFKEIPEENYSLLDASHFAGTEYSKKIRRFAYYRLEMFNLSEYDQVIYFDVDMVVIKNLDKLFDMRYDDGIFACEDTLVKIKKLKPKDFFDKHHAIQGGVIVAGKNLLTGQTYNDLISLLADTRRYDLADQSMFIEYFGNANKVMKLDTGFNCGRKLLRDGHIELKNVRIIHYPGSGKPTSGRSCKTFKYWHKAKEALDEFTKI